ncbi:MAG: GtrA family protein [Patescibacteria group bacterium]
MQKTHVQFFKYQAVSFGTFLADLAVIALLMFVFDANYLLATAAGFLTAVAISFFVNRMWSFRKWVHTGRIAVSLFVGLGTLCVVVFVTYVGVSQVQVPYIEARIVAALVAAVVSYVGDAIFTFEVKPFE